MSAMEQVILVDDSDQEIGAMDKLQAHQSGVLHRAFSVFIFNKSGHLLIHQRAEGKYHSSGLWTNTCCSHPRPNEEVAAAANRRLIEEMGLETEVFKVLDFVYRATLDNHLIEHEFDHVFVGYFDGSPVVNPSEVQDWKWIAPDLLMKQIQLEPHKFTAWFLIALPLVLEAMKDIKLEGQ